MLSTTNPRFSGGEGGEFVKLDVFCFNQFISFRIILAIEITLRGIFFSFHIVKTFKSVNYGPLGYIHNGKIDYQRTPARKHTSDTPFDVSKLNELPKVGIVYNYANASDLPAKALVDAGYDGIVSAGVGNGNLYKSVFDTLATAAKNGTAVVRSSRVPTGATTQDAEVDDAKYGFVASGTLNPQKARVLLQLALTQTKDPQQIQQIFNQY